MSSAAPRPPLKKPPTREMLHVGRAILWLRKEADMSQETAADRMGVTRQAWQQYEAGDRQIVLRTDVQDQIAEALGTDRQTLLMVKARLAGETIPSPDRPRLAAGGQPFLHIADPVRAGAFLAVDTADQSLPRFSHIGRDPRFPNALQRIRPIVGDSMDQLGILDGDWAQIASIDGMNFVPETGMVVEVERTRQQEREREYTLKQLEVTADGLLLWPRSNNPMWRSPINLTDGHNDEDVTVQITGLMTQLIRRF